MEPEERQLSDRERTVLLLAAEGLTDKEIAKHLGLSQRTIGTYWERMRLKLGPFSRTQLVALFLRNEAETGDVHSYRHLFGSWQDGVWILSPEGATLFTNDRVAHLFGLSPRGFRESEARKLIADHSPTSVEELLQSAKNQHREIEFSLPHPNGGKSWLRMAGSPVTDPGEKCSAVVLTVRDISLHRRVEHTLSSCQSTIEFLTKHSSDRIASFDSDLRCVGVNRSFADALPIGTDEVIGKGLDELGAVFRPLNAWQQALQDAVTSGESCTFESEDPSGESALTHLLPKPNIEAPPTAVLSITSLKR